MKYNDLKSELISSAIKTNTPILGEFELTAKCNFKCEMCYVDQAKKSLSKNDWKSIFDKAVKNGLLYALFTGGEAMLRDDFVELYEYLYDKGVKITVFSNGSIINDSIISSFNKRPPEMVNISIYGSNNSIYKDITKIESGFDMFDSGVTKLMTNNINISLRTIPLKNVYLDLDNIIKYSQSKGLILNYITYLTPSYKNSIVNRLNIEELLDFETRIKTAFNLKTDKRQRKESNQINCAALKSAYYINSYGEMQPCAIAFEPKQSILKHDFYETFMTLQRRMKELDQDEICSSCDNVSGCPTCFARRLYDNDSGCNSYLKEYTLQKGCKS